MKYLVELLKDNGQAIVNCDSMMIENQISNVGIESSNRALILFMVNETDHMQGIEAMVYSDEIKRVSEIDKEIIHYGEEQTRYAIEFDMAEQSKDGLCTICDRCEHWTIEDDKITFDDDYNEGLQELNLSSVKEIRVNNFDPEEVDEEKYKTGWEVIYGDGVRLINQMHLKRNQRK